MLREVSRVAPKPGTGRRRDPLPRRGFPVDVRQPPELAASFLCDGWMGLRRRGCALRACPGGSLRALAHESAGDGRAEVGLAVEA